MRPQFSSQRVVTLLAGVLATVAVAGPTAAWAANGIWNATADLGVVRGQNTATLLQDGRVLVVGQDRFGQMAAEIYDPALATWTCQSDPIRHRYDFAASLLPDGRVLIVGGDPLYGYKTSEAFNPSTGTWTITADLNVPRWNGRIAALADGRVLMAGGARVSTVDPLREAEIYDAASDTWTVTGSMVKGRP